MISLFVQFILLSSFSLLYEVTGHGYRPQDVCFITDHEPIPQDRCSYFAKLIRHAGFKDSLPPNYSSSLGHTLRSMNPSLFSSSSKFLNLYHQIIPCLNRHYACEAGYNFIMPSSPTLTILQNNTRIPNLRETLGEMNKVCRVKNVTLNKNWKGDIFKETRRSQTWCKVLLLERLLVKFPSCKIAVFLDADILIMPPREMTSKHTEDEVWKRGTSGLQRKDKVIFQNLNIKSLRDLAKYKDEKDDYFKTLISEEYLEFSLMGRTKSELECTNNDMNRLELHGKLGCEKRLLQLPVLQDFYNNDNKLIFTSSTMQGSTFGHEQWISKDKKLIPKTMEESLLKPTMKTWNNINNTKCSTSFMIMKNSVKTVHILRKWWNSVDPNFNPDYLDILGQPLRIYRTAWSHEQRVFDDFVSVVYKEHIELSPRPFDFNTPFGLYAQHYFKKAEHARQYIQVAVFYWSMMDKSSKCSVRGDNSDLDQDLEIGRFSKKYALQPTSS